MSRWRRIFRHRMASGAIIPPDARVDPGGFPEEDFPLYCPSCGYLLRGLSADRCPECGQSFDRGRLLVEQYVIEQGRRLSRRTSQYAKWTGVIGLSLLLAGTIHAGLLSYILDPAKPSTWSLNPIFTLYPVMLAFVLGPVLLLTSGVLSLHAAGVSKKKSKRVFDAVDQNTDSFKKAQRYQWVLFAAWLIGMIGVLVWEVRDARGWLHYYSERPSRLLLPVGVAVGVGIVATLFVRLRDWIRRRRRA